MSKAQTAVPEPAEDTIAPGSTRSFRGEELPDTAFLPAPALRLRRTSVHPDGAAADSCQTRLCGELSAKGADGFLHADQHQEIKINITECASDPFLIMLAAMILVAAWYLRRGKARRFTIAYSALKSSLLLVPSGWPVIAIARIHSNKRSETLKTPYSCAPPLPGGGRRLSNGGWKPSGLSERKICTHVRKLYGIKRANLRRFDTISKNTSGQRLPNVG